MTSNPEANGLTGPYYRPKTAAQYLDVAPSTLWALIAQQILDPPIKLSAGVSLFPQSALDAALMKRAAGVQSSKINNR